MSEPKTLKDYRELAVLLFPDAVPMLDEKIALQGEDEEVLADSSQMLFLVANAKPAETDDEPKEKSDG